MYIHAHMHAHTRLYMLINTHSCMHIHVGMHAHGICMHTIIYLHPDMGAQWLSGRVLDSRPKGRGFEPHRRQCIVVLEQDTFILA